MAYDVTEERLKVRGSEQITRDLKVGRDLFINGTVHVNNDGVLTTADKGVANGVASLDATGRVPYSQLPESAMKYKGTWDASTNTPTLADGTGTNGDFYVVSAAGTVTFSAGRSITFYVNDRVIYDGNLNEWERLPAGEVRSVNGQTGDVTLSIPAAQVNSDWNASSGVAKILNKPNLATVARTGDYNDLINKPSAGGGVPVGTIVFGTLNYYALNNQEYTGCTSYLEEETLNTTSSAKVGVGQTSKGVILWGKTKSIDNGATFTDITGTTTFRFFNVQQFYVDNDSDIYAAGLESNKPAIYKSTDGGSSFNTRVFLHSTMMSNFSAIQFYKAPSGKMYVVYNKSDDTQSAIFYSTDGGTTWSQFSSTFNYVIRTIVEYAGVLYIVSSTGILSSVNDAAPTSLHNAPSNTTIMGAGWDDENEILYLYANRNNDQIGYVFTTINFGANYKTLQQLDAAQWYVTIIVKKGIPFLSLNSQIWYTFDYLTWPIFTLDAGWLNYEIYSGFGNNLLIMDYNNSNRRLSTTKMSKVQKLDKSQYPELYSVIGDYYAKFVPGIDTNTYFAVPTIDCANGVYAFIKCV